MIRHFVLLVLAVGLMFVSCIESFDVTLPEADTDQLVIEGNIFSDTHCTFYLSRTVALDYEDSAVPYVGGASLSVVGADGSSYPSSEDAIGVYSIEVGTLSDNVEYWLEIRMPDGDVFRSEAMCPMPTPSISEITFAQPREDRLLDIMVTCDAPSSGEVQYLRWTYDETWELHAPFRPYYEYDPETDQIVPRTLDTGIGWKQAASTGLLIGSSKEYVGHRFVNHRIYTISHRDMRLSVCYRTRIRQYALSQRHYEYEEARRKLSTDMGGLFSPLPSELPGNVSSSDGSRRVIGYVGVCSRPAEAEVYIFSSQVDYETTSFPSILTKEEIAGRKDRELYKAGYRIVFYDPILGAKDWSSEGNVDVRLMGASLERPLDWDPPAR